jgi:hypothetical protein
VRVVKDLSDLYEALAPRAKPFRGSRSDTAGIGGAGSDPKPWGATLEQLTVRQLMNRISEHTGPRGWVDWEGL